MKRLLLLCTILLALAAFQLNADPAPLAKDAFCVPSGIGFVCCYSCGFGNYCCAYSSCDATQGPCPPDQDG